VILILLLLVLWICLFSGLALFVAKLFVVGLLLLPVVAVAGFFLFWRSTANADS
jgi:hypothetical protein